MAEVGDFLFRWSLLEIALSESIQKLSTAEGEAPRTVKDPFADRLEHWRSLNLQIGDAALLETIMGQAQEIRAFRNLLVHGLAGGNSAPSDGGAPHIQCIVGGWENPTGEIGTFTISDLKHRAKAADACRRAFSYPQRFNYRL